MNPSVTAGKFQEKSVRLTTDKRGVLRDPDVHDVNLCGLLLSQRTLELYFLDPVNNASFSILIPEVVDCQMEGFKEGNIVFEIQFFQPSILGADIDGQMQHYGPPDRTAAFENARKAMAIRASNENLTFIQISTSYGCDLIAISSSPPDQAAWERRSE